MNTARYLYLDCMLLAIAVHQLTGWPLVEMLYPYHVLAGLPDGRLLDVAGPHDPSCLAGFRHRDADIAALERGLGRRVTPDVLADARELLAGLAELDADCPGSVTPLSFRPRPARVSGTGSLQSPGLAAVPRASSGS